MQRRTKTDTDTDTENPNSYINRKNFHSINVQIICDVDLNIINCIAKWPGSVHDSRILRESQLFADFESDNKPLNGILLGDNGYMLRDWLFTPILNPATEAERKYNDAHRSTRNTVERCNGVLKHRWSCLRTELRLQPPKVCQVIYCCAWLHNRAIKLGIEAPDGDHTEPDMNGGNVCANDSNQSERARFLVGKNARNQLIRDNF